MWSLYRLQRIRGNIDMGGNGGGRSLGDIKRLEAVANQALERKRRNIFISFAFEDVNEVNLLRGQAKNDQTDIEFIDRSLQAPFNSTRGDYIRSRLEERINQASMTVVYLSKDTRGSEWVAWEVKKSIELEKVVVAVHAGDNPPSKLPSFVKEYGIKVVPWSRLAGEVK